MQTRYGWGRVWVLGVLAGLLGCGGHWTDEGEEEALGAPALELLEQSAGGDTSELTGKTQWVRLATGPLDEFRSRAVFDRHGNIIVAVEFAESLDFGAGPLAGTGGSEEFLIGLAKYRGDGTLLWARKFAVEPGSATTPFSRGAFLSDLKVDRRNNILLAGHHDGVLDLGGEPLAAGSFLAKFDSEGEHLWSRRLGGDFVEVRKIAVDRSGHIAVSGSFRGTLDFGRGPLTSEPSFDPFATNAFLARFTPDGSNLWTFVDRTGPNASSVVTVDSQQHLILVTSTRPVEGFTFSLITRRISPEGSPLWTRRVEALSGASGVATHGNRIVVVGGGASEGFTFGGRRVTGDGSGFMLAYTRDGDPRWARIFGFFISDVAMDVRDGVVIVGSYDDGQDLGLGPVPFFPGSDENLFVARYDRIHGTPSWVRPFPMEETGVGIHSVAVTKNGESVVTGRFHNPTDFGTGTVTPMGFQDIFILKLAR